MATEKTSFSMPASNVGSSIATQQLIEAFGPGKWDKPPQLAAMLDGLIAMTQGIRDAWQEEKPMFPALSDPGGVWKQEDAELARALVIYRAMREEVGRVTQLNNADAVSPLRDALLFGRWDFYDETGTPKPKGVKSSDTLPLVQIPYRVSAAMGAVIKHNHELVTKIPEFIGESIAEAPRTVGDVVGKAAKAAGDAAGSASGGLVMGIWSALPPAGKVAAVGTLALLLRKLWREGGKG